jgi:hypothetical protein
MFAYNRYVMPTVITRRLDLLREIAARPFAKVSTAIYATLGLIGVLRELVLPEPMQAKFNFYRFWRLDWPWYLWTIAALVLLLATVFAGAFNAVRRRETESHADPGDFLAARPKVTITGDRRFEAENVGTTAAYRLTARINLPGTKARLELEPLARVMPSSPERVRFVGHELGQTKTLDEATLPIFMSQALLGDVQNWTLANYEPVDIEFDLEYSDFEGAFVFTTPHTLHFGLSRTEQVVVSTQRSARAESLPKLQVEPSSA